MRRLFSILSDDHKKVASNAFLVFSYRIFQKFVAFATVFFLVRALTPEQFGEYNFILSILSFSTITALPGLQESVTQSAARGYKGTYRKAQPIALLFSLVGSSILLFVAIWQFFLDNYNLTFGFSIAAILFPFSFGLEQWKGLRKGMEDFKTIVRMGGLFSTIQGILTISAVLLVPNSYLLPVFFFLLVPLIKNVFMTYKAYSIVPQNDVVEMNSLPHGYKVSAYSIFNIAANNIDHILLFTLLSPTALAVYVIANKFPELIKKLIQDVGAVLAPRFARHEEYSRQTDRYIKVFSLLIGISIIGFSFTLLPFLITFVFGDVYQNSILYAQIIMCSLAIGNVSILQSRYITSKLDTKSFRDITMIMSLTRIISSIILVPVYGLLGAVISACIYRLVMMVTVQFIMRKRYAFEN